MSIYLQHFFVPDAYIVKGLEAMIRDPNIRKSQKALENVTEFIENPGGKFKDLGKAVKEGFNKGIKKE